MNSNFTNNQTDFKSYVPKMTIYMYANHSSTNITLNSKITYTILLENQSNVNLESVNVIDNLTSELHYIKDSLKINGIQPFVGDINLNDTDVIPIGVVRCKSPQMATNSLIVITFDVEVIDIPSENTINNFARVVYKFFDVEKDKLDSDICTSNETIIDFVSDSATEHLEPVLEGYEVEYNDSSQKMLELILEDSEPEFDDSDESELDTIDEVLEDVEFKVELDVEFDDNNYEIFESTEEMLEQILEDVEAEFEESEFDEFDEDDEFDEEPEVENIIDVIHTISPVAPMPRQPLLYTIYIKNNSSEPLEDILFHDTISKGVDYLPASFTVNLESFTIDDTFVTDFDLKNGISLDTIPANGSALIQYQVVLNRRTYKKPIVNTVEFSYLYNSDPKDFTSTISTTISNINFYSSNYIDTESNSPKYSTTKSFRKSSKDKENKKKN